QTTTTPVPYDGTVTLATADDVYYAVPVTLGTPGQPLRLSIAMQHQGLIEVSAYSLPHYSRHNFTASNSSTFHSKKNTSDSTQGLDNIQFADDKASYQLYLEIDEVTRARQLFDAQPWDGWIGLDALSGVINVFEYVYDLRRRCTNGKLDEDAGTMTFGTMDGPGCEGDFTPLPSLAGPGCTRENFEISRIAAGGEESEPFPMTVFLAERDDFCLPHELFKPIKVAYNTSKIIHGRYVVDCNRSYPPIAVTLASNETLVFDHWNLVYRKDGKCFLRVTDMSDLQDPGCGVHYIGISLFHQFCVAFDFYDANQMMVRAKKKNASDPSNICDYSPPSTTSTSMTSTTSGKTCAAFSRKYTVRARMNNVLLTSPGESRLPLVRTLKALRDWLIKVQATRLSQSYFRMNGLQRSGPRRILGRFPSTKPKVVAITSANGLPSATAIKVVVAAELQRLT
ncbi:hypothetical protein AAVH_18772, partial [Aphelenchoides avenae]